MNVSVHIVKSVVQFQARSTLCPQFACAGVCRCVCVHLPQTTDHINPKRRAATELTLRLNNLTERKREKRSLSVNCPNTV